MFEPGAHADLGPAQVLMVSGADASAFLHAQLASNVNGLGTGEWQWSVWLDARGRVRWLCQVARCDDQHFLLLLRGGDAAVSAAALQPFIFRLQVSISVLESSYLAVGPALPMHALIDQGAGSYALGLGDRSLIISSQAAPADPALVERFMLADIRAGLPSLPENALGHLLPPALSLYRLQAVALDKGCYPGQEIVARLHHLGGHKQCLCRLANDGSLHAGDAIHTADKSAGQVLVATTTELLCVVKQETIGSEPSLNLLEIFAA